MCRRSELIPVALAGDRLAILIKLTEVSGITGWGEAAPAPQWGTEDWHTCWRVLEELTDLWTAGVFHPQLAQQYASFPTAWHGMELAWLHLLAQQRRQRVAQLLNPACVPQIALNGVIGNTDLEETKRQAARLVRRGLRCIKLKIGDRPFAEDLKRILAVQELGDVQIRLDVNQKWTVPQAIDHLRFLEKLALPIQYVEQPIPAEAIADLRIVKEHTAIAIAGDEAVRSMAQLQQIIEYQAVDYVILKPMFIGGLMHSYRMGQTAIEAGIRPVVTNTFDGYWAWYGALQLASALQISDPCGLSVYQSYGKQFPSA